jgi:uncharacterized integral membrane protein
MYEYIFVYIELPLIIIIIKIIIVGNIFSIFFSCTFKHPRLGNKQFVRQFWDTLYFIFLTVDEKLFLI